MTEKRFEFREVNNCGITPKLWDNEKQEYANLLECADWLNKLSKEKEVYKMLWEQMSYYFEDGVELKDLDEKDFRRLQRLAKGLID